MLRQCDTVHCALCSTAQCNNNPFRRSPAWVSGLRRAKAWLLGMQPFLRHWTMHALRGDFCVRCLCSVPVRSSTFANDIVWMRSAWRNNIIGMTRETRGGRRYVRTLHFRRKLGNCLRFVVPHFCSCSGRCAGLFEKWLRHLCRARYTRFVRHSTLALAEMSAETELGCRRKLKTS